MTNTLTTTVNRTLPRTIDMKNISIALALIASTSLCCCVNMIIKNNYDAELTFGDFSLKLHQPNSVTVNETNSQN